MTDAAPNLKAELSALRAREPEVALQVEEFLGRYFDLDASGATRLVNPSPRTPVVGRSDAGLDARLNWPTRDCHWAGHGGNGEAADLFVHKNLGDFLARELRAFLGIRFMSALEAGEDATAPSREAVTVQQATQALIEQLHLAEEARRVAWGRPRPVVESFWCVTLDRLSFGPAPADGPLDPEGVDARLVADIAANTAQRAEWTEQLEDGDHPPPGDADLDQWTSWLDAHPTLVLDTRHFSTAFEAAVLSRFHDLDAATNGLLVHADNADGLRLLRARFGGGVQCVYIDPPFNTEGVGFAYRDRFSTSAWLTMMDDRLELAVPLLTEDATLYAHVDYNEKERLKLLLDEHLEYVTEIIWRIGWVSGFKSAAKKFVRNHDTIYQYGRTSSPYFDKTYIPYPDGYRRRDGKPPTGPGYPLEDTWNCSELDPLHSIQIMSFSREKLGLPELTQKNENLLARMIRSSTRPGDTVLDYFLGSGTTAAAAHKLGRRWIGIERGEWLVDAALPRLKRVLAGDPYGISGEVGWTGGGLFQYVRLASETPDPTTSQVDPQAAYDRFETALLLLGLRVTRRYAADPATGWDSRAAVGTLPDGCSACVVHAAAPGNRDASTLTRWVKTLPVWSSHESWVLCVNDDARGAVPTNDETVEIRSLDTDLHRLLFAADGSDAEAATPVG